MKTLFVDFTLTGLLLGSLLLSTCGYKEQGHANTPAENPGSQMKVGVDTVAHPGNIDRDTINLHK
jgi:hypothetical protein